MQFLSTVRGQGKIYKVNLHALMKCMFLFGHIEALLSLKLKLILIPKLFKFCAPVFKKHWVVSCEHVNQSRKYDPGVYAGCHPKCYTTYVTPD